jgi:hypothetical protein
LKARHTAALGQGLNEMRMAPDEEKGSMSIRYITGFGELASLTASDVDHTTEVYKRFDRLAVRDLLYYECELLELEALQDRYDCEDALDARRPENADDLRRRIRTNARDWSSFKHKATKETEAGKEPMSVGRRGWTLRWRSGRH